MPLHIGGTSLNWDYYPDDFETKTEETTNLEKEYRQNPNQILPPRKRQKTVHFGNRDATSEAAAKKTKVAKIKQPIHQRLFNTDSLVKKRKTAAILKHNITKTAFQYFVTYEDDAKVMWRTDRGVLG